MSSAQSSSGAETCQHHTQYPSLQTALDFHQSSLLNTRNNSHYNRLISHPKLCNTISLQTGILILWPFVNKIMIPSRAMLWRCSPSLLWQQSYPLAKIHQLLLLTILFQYVRKNRQRTFLCHYSNHKTLKCGWMFDYCLQMCLPCLAFLASTHRQGNKIHTADSVNSSEWKERKMVSRGDLQFDVRCKAPTEYLIFFTFSGRCKDFCFWAAKSAQIWPGIKLITFWITVQCFILRSSGPQTLKCDIWELSDTCSRNYGCKHLAQAQPGGHKFLAVSIFPAIVRIRISTLTTPCLHNKRLISTGAIHT